jgi:hypothetical protein
VRAERGADNRGQRDIDSLLCNILTKDDMNTQVWAERGADNRGQRDRDFVVQYLDQR